MQIYGPFDSEQKAEEAKKQHAGEADMVYTRPHLEGNEGEFVVVCENKRMIWNRPPYGGCPRGR